ncbi:MAG TPA: hypothetical protein VHF06_00010 [Pseudonocardiaceae bacterium]|nr:hypothetical protein [Pseudonocardiaceae bacterium]
MGASRRAVLIAALAAGTAVTLTTPATAATAAAQPFPASTTHTVTLITGDQVTLTTSANGATNATVRSGSSSRAFESFRAGNGDRYVIPAIATPYLDQLDKSLFDVSALARAGIDGTAKLPVHLSFPAGTAPTAPAGVTLTSVSGSTATGYLTPSSAPAFGSALRHQVGTDVQAGHRAGTTALPASISLAGAPQGGVSPHYPLHILQVDATDMNGQPASTVGLLMNVDQVDKEANYIDIESGLGKIAVPAGNYALYVFFSDFDADGNVTASRQVAVDTFVVSDTAPTTSVTADERSATSQIKVTSPKPANQDLISTTLVRSDANGTIGFATGLGSFGDTPVYVSPVAEPTVGSLHYIVQWGGAAPDPADRYHVDLAFAADQIPADESFVGKPNQLATVRDVLYSDPAAGDTPATVLAGASDPTLDTIGGGFAIGGEAAPAPGVFTDYLGTADSGEWVQNVVTPSQIYLQADPHTYHSGQRATVEWGHGPVAAGLGQWNSPQFCDACAAGDTYSLAIPIDRDSVADHTGLPFSAAPVHFTLYRNDTVVFDGDNYYGASVTVPQEPATFRGVLDVDQTGIDGVSQAVKTHTEETVTYDPAAPGAPLPATDACASTDATIPCYVTGAISVGYQLRADLTNTSTSPVQVLGLRVGHVAYNGSGSHSPIKSVTVSVSFDNGTTWHRVPVVGARGDYTAIWPNPAGAKGTSPWLKVTASDAAGDAFSQTVSNAYTIGK